MRGKFSLMLIILMMAWVLMGCVTIPGKKAVAESVELEIIPTSVASVAEASVVQEGAKLIVSGWVEKFHEFTLPGHVDIVIHDPQGTVVARQEQAIKGYASKRGGVKEGRFTSVVKMVPAAGSKVCIRYHAAASGDGHLDCT